MENTTAVKNMTVIIQDKHEEDVIHKNGNETTYSNLAIENTSDEDLNSVSVHTSGSKTKEVNNYTDDDKTTDNYVKEGIIYVNDSSLSAYPLKKEVEKNTKPSEDIRDTQTPRIQVKDEMKSEDYDYLSGDNIPKKELKEKIINEGLVDSKTKQNYLLSEVKKVVACRELRDFNIHSSEVEVKKEIKSEESNYLNGFKSVKREVSIKAEDGNTNKNLMTSFPVSDEMEGIIYEHDNINKVLKPTQERVINFKDNIKKGDSDCESDKNDMKEITINCSSTAKSHILFEDPVEESYNMQVHNEIELFQCFPSPSPMPKNCYSPDIKLLQKPVVLLVDLKYCHSSSSKRCSTSSREIIVRTVNETIDNDGKTEKTLKVESSTESVSYFDIDENGFFKCLLCSFKTVYRSNLISHQLAHSDKRPFPCDQCEFKAKRKFDLQVHVQRHKMSYPYECNLCNYKAKTRSNFRTHLQRHSDPDSLRCLICDKVFTAKGNLTAHVKYVHNELKYLFNCKFCNFVTKRKPSLTNHINIVHTKKHMFKCTYCSYSTARKGDLSRHSMKHTGKKPYSCSLCSFKCTNSGSLKCHMRTHTDERPFSCSLCDKKFKMKYTLNDHMITHKVSKEFHCSKCDFATATAKQLKSHSKTHTYKKPYKCSSCSYSSKTISCLNVHKKLHSGNFINCELCDYKTPFKVNMKSHIQTHEGIRPFKCNLCDFSSRSKYPLEAHFESEHSKNKSKKKCVPKKRDFPCDICSFVTVSFGYLRNHLKLKHKIMDF